MNRTIRQALKYNVDANWQQMYGHLAADPEHRQPHSVVRGVAADAADDLAGYHTGEQAERLREQAELLRSEHPIYTWRGQVYQQHPNPNPQLHRLTNPLGEQAADLAGRIAQGDNTAYDEMGHLLGANNHPALPLFERLANGEGIENPSVYALAHRAKGSHPYLEDHAIGGGHWRNGYSSIKVANHADRPYIVIRHIGPDTGGQRAERTVALPSTKEEATKFLEAMRPVHPLFAEASLPNLEGEVTYTPEQRQREEGFREYAGLPPLPAEGAEQHRTLQKALKYVTAQPEDMLHLLHSPDATNSLIWADLLNDHNQLDLENRVRREAEGSAVKRPKTPDMRSTAKTDLQDDLHRLHPSPAIRALADGGDNPQTLGYLIKALQLSPNPEDQDAAVVLAPDEKPHPHHAAKRVFDQLSNSEYRWNGLTPKLVGDTLYLLDWHHPEEGYPPNRIRTGRIVYHAPVSDKEDLAGMVVHANELMQQPHRMQM